MVSEWENGRTRPRPEAIDLLCRLYQTRPDRLGFGGDYSDTASGSISPARGRQEPPPAGVEAHGHEGLMMELDEILHRLGGTLNKETADSAVTHLERRAANYDALFRTGTSGNVMIDVARDLRDTHEVLEGDHTPEIQRRLLEVMARLSGMLGIGLLHMGDIRAADKWLNMAELAAERNENRDLRGWVTARQALVPLYYGNRRDALDLATKALNLTGRNSKTAAAARAEIIRSRVLAQTPGQQNAALAAADHARHIHAELSGPDATDGIIGLTATQLAGHLGEIYTHAGRPDEAFAQQTIVLDRVTGTSPEGCLEPDGCLDVTLTRLQRGLGYIKSHEPEEACREMTEAVLSIPAICCTPMIRREIRNVAGVVPSSARTTSSYRDLTDAMSGLHETGRSLT